MEREPLDIIWRKERRWVASVLLAHMPPGADLEDLLQEVALALVRHTDEVRSRDNFRPWLRTVTLNIARGAHRQEQSSLRRKERSLDPEAREVADQRPLREQEAKKARQATANTLKKIEELPPKHREILLLRCVNGLSQKRIAKILGLPETTVESRLARARRKLRATLSTVQAVPVHDEGQPHDQ